MSEELRKGGQEEPASSDEMVERMREHIQHPDDSMGAVDSAAPARRAAPVRPDVGDENTPPSTTMLAAGEQAATIGADTPRSGLHAAGETVGEAVSQAREVASRAADQANDRADQAMNIAGEQLGNAAQALRKQAPAGRAGEITERAADTLERGGTYLRDSDLSSIVADIALAVRRNPLPWALGAVGLGYMLSRRGR